jgi:hypothetical protein
VLTGGFVTKPNLFRGAPMHALRFFVLPSLAVAVWMSLVVGTLLGFGEFATAMQRPAQVRPTHAPAVDAPVLTASR